MSDHQIISESASEAAHELFESYIHRRVASARSTIVAWFQTFSQTDPKDRIPLRLLAACWLWIDYGLPLAPNCTEGNAIRCFLKVEPTDAAFNKDRLADWLYFHFVEAAIALHREAYSEAAKHLEWGSSQLPRIRQLRNCFLRLFCLSLGVTERRVDTKTLGVCLMKYLRTHPSLRR